MSQCCDAVVLCLLCASLMSTCHVVVGAAATLVCVGVHEAYGFFIERAALGQR